MEIEKLTEDQINTGLKELNNWVLKDSKLHKLFKFKTFNQALRFIVGVGVECEKINHHPEWYNVYGNVDVDLITHKVNGLTKLDFDLAKIMDKIESDFKSNN